MNWHLTSKRGFAKIFFFWRDISQDTPSSTKLNSAGLFSQIVCLSVCCIFHYFLKQGNNLFRNFAWTLRGNYSGGPNAWNYFYICHFTQGCCFKVSFFAQFYKSSLFYVPAFLENHSIASHQTFYRCSWYYSEGYLTRKTFSQHLPICWEPV